MDQVVDVDQEHEAVLSVFRRPVFGSAEVLGETGTWAWDQATERLIWSDNLYRLYGLEPGAVTPTPALVAEMTLPADRDWLHARVADLDESGRFKPFEHRIVRPDGEVRRLHAMAVAPATDGPLSMGTAHDVTGAHRLETEIAAHVAVGDGLTDWRNLAQGGALLLARLGRALGCVAGVLWVPKAEELSAAAVWRGPRQDEPELPEDLDRVRVAPGAGAAGRAWAERRPVCATAEDRDPRLMEATGERLVGSVAIPAIRDADTLAVLELFTPPGEELPTYMVDSLEGMGREIGLFLHRRRGELAPPVLTGREREVLQLSARGWSGPEIAARLSVTHATIRTHFENIYDKYGVSGRAAAVAEALRQGLIE